jgi:outer membrane protein TolC
MSPPSLLAGVPAQLLRNRPDIRAAELELAASKADLNAARALFYPKLEIHGLMGLQAFRPDLLALFAQQNALITRLELVEMKQRELMMGVGVYRALGGGWR